MLRNSRDFTDCVKFGVLNNTHNLSGICHMKKIAIVLSFFIYSSIVFAQGGWIECGLKGGYGVNFLINKNYYSDHNFSPKLSFGYMYGGKIGINFNETHSVTVDVTSSVFEQKYNYSTLNADSLTRSIYTGGVGFNTLDFLLMYRKASDGGYIEIGPQYSMVSKVKLNDGGSSATPVADPSSNMIKSYYAAVFGFGGYLVGTENFRVTIGFRAAYGLTDLITSAGKQNNFPVRNTYPAYKPTNPLTGMMVLEMNYDIGYFSRSKCKKRKVRFLLF